MTRREILFQKRIIALATRFIKNVAGGQRWNNPQIQQLIEDAATDIYSDAERKFEEETVKAYDAVIRERFVTKLTSEADILFDHPDLAHDMVMMANYQARVITSVFGIGMTQSLIDLSNLCPEVSNFLREHGCDALADACTRDIGLQQIQRFTPQTPVPRP